MEGRLLKYWPGQMRQKGEGSEGRTNSLKGLSPALGFGLKAFGLKGRIQQNACIQQFVYGLGNGSGGTQDINVPEVVNI